MIWFGISDSRSLASCCIEGTDESFPRVDSQIINPDSDQILKEFTILTQIIMHLVYPPKFCKAIVSISPGFYSRLKRNPRQWLCNVLGVNKVHYDLYENSECTLSFLDRFFCELHKGGSASAQTPLCLILRINYELFQ